MTPAQQQNAAKEFIQRWTGNGYEKGDTQKFWLELLQKVFGISDPYAYAANNPVCNVDWMGLYPNGFQTKPVLMPRSHSRIHITIFHH